MNFLKHISKNNLFLILFFVFLFIFSATINVFATDWPYAPGATLNPGCLPGATNCVVTGGWGLTGNSGTVDGTNFIGTTDNIPLNFRVNNVRAGKIDGTEANTFLGYQAGKSVTSGGKNTFLGASSGYIISSGYENSFFGYQAGYSNTIGAGNVFLGYQAGYHETGSNKLFIDNQDRGSEANDRIKSLIYGTFDADPANQVLTVNGKIKITQGVPGAGKVLTSDADGLATWEVNGGSGWSLTGNTGTTDITTDPDGVLTAGNFIGNIDNIPLNFVVNNYKAGRIDGTLRNSFWGYKAGNVNTTGYENTFIGTSTGNNNVDGGSNTFLGYSAGLSNTSGNDNVFIGADAGLSNTTGGSSVFIGTFAGHNSDAGAGNVFIGASSGYGNTTGYGNVSIGGYGGGGIGTGNVNTFVGGNSGYANTSGGYNSFLGGGSGAANTSGGFNSFIGNNSGVSNISGEYNSFLGFESGHSNISGSNNTYIGDFSGYLTTGSNNVFLGYQAGYSETGNNKLYIANSNTATPLIGGDFSTGNVEIKGGNLEIGKSDAQKGITLYDTATGSAYCVTIASGALAVGAGVCAI